MPYSGYDGIGYEFFTPEVPPTPVPIPDLGSTPGLRVLLDIVTDMNPSEWHPNIPVWTDISAYVRQPGGFANGLGRQRPLDRNEAGTANLSFDNYDRRFDPENDDSPLFGGIAPMRHIRVESVHERNSDAFTMASSEVGGPDLVGGGDSFTYVALFDGLTEAWDFEYPANGLDAVANVKCVDLFGMMSRDQFDYILLMGGREAAVNMDIVLNTRWYTGTVEGGNVDPAGLLPGDDLYQSSETPSPYRDFSYANGLLVGGAQIDSGSVLENIAAFAESEGGNLFIRQDGRITYRDRLWHLHPVDELRFAVDAERFHDVARQMDETLVYNDITLTNEDWGQVAASDLASQERYGKRTKTFASVLIDSGDAAMVVQDILFRHRDPHIIVARLDLSNVVADWETVLSRTLWDAILLEVPLPNGDLVVQRSMIEGIEVNTPSKNEWNVFWWLSVPPFPDLLETDFEDNTVQGWTAGANCSLDVRQDSPGTFDAIQGTYSLRMTPTSNADMSALSPAVTVEARREYLATITAKHTGSVLTSKTAHLEIDWFQGATFLSTVIGADTTVGTQARLLTVSARAPGAADTAYLRFYEDSADTAHPAYLDSATFARSA